MVIKLIPEWRTAHQFWSVRIAAIQALFWSAAVGLFYALPVFMEWFSPVHFALICVGFSVAIGLARLTHQPGLE